MFITFEGIEGCGKSTQCRMLKQWLEARGRSVLLTLEPGGSRLGRQLRSILLDMASQDLTGESELFLYLADRSQHVSQVIGPALARGEVVISDRYADSTVVFQKPRWQPRLRLQRVRLRSWLRRDKSPWHGARTPGQGRSVFFIREGLPGKQRSPSFAQGYGGQASGDFSTCLSSLQAVQKPRWQGAYHRARPKRILHT